MKDWKNVGDGQLTYHVFGKYSASHMGKKIFKGVYRDLLGGGAKHPEFFLPPPHNFLPPPVKVLTGGVDMYRQK